jgi:hypothetical protein
MSVGTTGADYAPEYIPPQPEYVAEAPPPPPEPELPPELPPVTDPAAQAAAPAANANLEQSAMSNLGTDPSAPAATPAPAGDVPGGAFSFNLPPIEAPAIPGALPSGNGLTLGGGTTSPLFDGTIPAAPAGGEPVKADPNFYAKAAQDMAPEPLKGVAKLAGIGMDNIANVGGGIETVVGGMAKAGGDAFNTVTNGENYAKFGQEWQKDPLGATRDAIGGLGKSAWNIGPGVLAFGGGLVTEASKQLSNAPANIVNSIAIATQQDDKVQLKTDDTNYMSESFKLLGEGEKFLANGATSLTGMRNGSEEAVKKYGAENAKSHTFDAANFTGDIVDFGLGIVTGKGLFDMAGDAIKGGLKKGGKEVVEEGAEQIAKQGAQQGAETAAGAGGVGPTDAQIMQDIQSQLKDPRIQDIIAQSQTPQAIAQKNTGIAQMRKEGLITASHVDVPRVVQEPPAQVSPDTTRGSKQVAAEARARQMDMMNLAKPETIPEPMQRLPQTPASEAAPVTRASLDGAPSSPSVSFNERIPISDEPLSHIRSGGSPNIKDKFAPVLDAQIDIVGATNQKVSGVSIGKKESERMRDYFESRTYVEGTTEAQKSAATLADGTKGNAAYRMSQDESVREVFKNNPDALAKLENGNIPDGWDMHHKMPLILGGQNTYDNFILIPNIEHDFVHRISAKLEGDLAKLKPGTPFSGEITSFDPSTRIHAPENTIVELSAQSAAELAIAQKPDLNALYRRLTAESVDRVNAPNYLNDLKIDLERVKSKPPSVDATAKEISAYEGRVRGMESRIASVENKLLEEHLATYRFSVLANPK